MTPYPKRLIEVDLPIKEISRHARREKSIRHGHISTLHIWWARRPLAACRAVICAALWPDPADDLCPPAFRQAVGRILPAFADRVRGSRELAGLSPMGWARWNRLTPAAWRADHPGSWADMRYALLDFIADFANWDNSVQPAYLEAARELTQAAHEALGGAPGTRPLVVDPFAGGGAIPLEALRVGADAFASDLNPVAVLLNKVVLEYIPQYGQRLADEVRKWGRWIKEEAEKELAEFYPKDPDGATPIAYLWARTITCEGPGCGAEVPLIKSLWLGKKPHNSWSLRLVGNARTLHVKSEVVRGVKPDEVGEGTVRRGSATCVCCGYTTPSSSVRRQICAKNGGASDARLLCVVTVRPNDRGRYYRDPTPCDLEAVSKAVARLRDLQNNHNSGLSLTPDEPTPIGGGKGAGRAFSQRNYGMDYFGDLFTPRQLLTLVTLISKIKEARRRMLDEVLPDLSEAVQAVLALNVDKMTDYGSSLASWSSPASQETVRGTFSRPALQMVWDFAEAYPFANSSGGWSHNLSFLISPLEAEVNSHLQQGYVERSSATRHPLPNDIVDAFVTDPPYYDAIPYADLSDYFVVWLKRSLQGSVLARDFSTLSPKEQECVVDEIKGHDPAFFERTMREALAEGRRVTKPGGIGIVVFAHKSTQGWEAQLQAMIDAGWTVTGSWPIDTEREGRVRANASAALASSVHLVCRPRPDAETAQTARNYQTGNIGDWRGVLQELPLCIQEWLPRLAQEGVVGADAIFACLGPALEIYSRYARVERADGSVVPLSEYLEYVWGAVSKEALNMVFAGADTSGFEADARLTAMWLWTLSTPDTDSAGPAGETNDEDEEAAADARATAGPGFSLEYDAARKIAQGLGAYLEQLGNLVEIKGSTARLLPVAARAAYLLGKETVRDTRQARRAPGAQQLTFFAQQADAAVPPGRLDVEGGAVETIGQSTLDRVHQSMLLFAGGRSEALKRFLVVEGVGRDEAFWRLAQALSALYPPGSDEKRWVDGVLARKKGLGM